ncbi:MAG: hypothetical protein FWG63_11550 [Defluviitaleaceae bacterium]|nr:hypothetical protein [Defluviitaleaceae bacterium]
MKYFVVKEKSEVGFTKPVEINEINFEKLTNSHSPYIQRNGEENRYFAFCPHCKNPVQIVGLYKKQEQKQLDTVRKAFGRHTENKALLELYKSAVPYKTCPYFAPRNYDINARRSKDDELDIFIRADFVNHFDKIVHVLKNTTGIRYGNGLLIKMIDSYCYSVGWNYIGATLENIPWIFGYMAKNQNLFGQYIKKDGFLHNELKKEKYNSIFSDGKDFVKFNGFKNKGAFLKHFYTQHNSSPKNGVLSENITMVVHIDYNNGDSSRILEKKLTFDHDYYHNIKHYNNWVCDEEKLKLVAHLKKM